MGIPARSPLLAGVLAGFLMTCVTPTAQAAPQILAALPSSVGIPFTCLDGVCQADLSTYCLQRKRPAPNFGTVYTPAAAEDFKLVIKTGDGVTTLAAAEHVNFVESRGFMAISAVIDEPELRKLGGTDAKLTIGEAASLLPVAEPNDLDPLTESEIAYVTKWRRAEGGKIVDSKPEAHAAQLLASVVNRLPNRGGTMPNVLDTVWEQAIGDEINNLPPMIAEPVLMRARAEFELCRNGGTRHSYGGVRRCLEFRHDDMIRNLNIEYWDTEPNS